MSNMRQTANREVGEDCSNPLYFWVIRMIRDTVDSSLKLGKVGRSVVLNHDQNMKGSRLSWLRTMELFAEIFHTWTDHKTSVKLLSRSSIYQVQFARYRCQTTIHNLPCVLLFSRMRSRGSCFTLGVWGLRLCSLDGAQPSATVHNRSQPSATLGKTVRNRSREVAMAVPMASSATGRSTLDMTVFILLASAAL